MSKPLLLLSAGVIGTGISATGAYALGAFKGNSGSKLSPPLTSSMPEELNDFTTDPKKYGCIGDKNMFQGLNVSEDISGSSEIRSGFLDNSKGTNGCLLVN